jgi:hypothetical protein
MKPEYYRVPLDVFKLSKKENKWPLKSYDDDVDDVEVPSNSQSEARSDDSVIENNCHFERENVKKGEIDNVWTRGDFVLK